MRFLQILSSLTFVVLYVWSTYSAAKPFSVRFNLDIALCALFATEWLWRLFVSAFCRCALSSPCIPVNMSAALLFRSPEGKRQRAQCQSMELPGIDPNNNKSLSSAGS